MPQAMKKTIPHLQQTAQLMRLRSFILIFASCGFLPCPTHGKDESTTLVKSIEQLQKSVSVAKPGDVIVLADGIYDQRYKLSAKGTVDKPIIIRAETSGDVVIKQALDLQGEYVSLVGIQFSDKGSVAIKGRGCRFSRCVMTNVQSGKWLTVAAGSKNIEIDHCRFENKKNNLEMQRGCQLIQITVLNKNERHHIHHNHFRDVPRGPSGNGYETLQLITKGNPKNPKAGHSETTIENNLFERCNGEAEIISIKSNGNLIRGNTFRACQGSLVFRHGDSNTASCNYFFGDGEKGSGGVRMQGSDHVVANNYFSGLESSAITMMDGTTDDFYVRVERVHVLFNTFLNCQTDMTVGVKHSKYPNGSTPKDCLVAGNIFYTAPGHNAGIILQLIKNDPPEAWRWVDNTAYGKLGIAATDGIHEGDPNLSIRKTGLATPTSSTPSAKKLPEEAASLTTDILGNARGKQPTLGAIEYPVKTIKAPLTAQQVGPVAR